ncbi:hypothetical protein AMJ80_01890 [bacterium SM23_31]|nr:MAG: hypothetical protein AMJ80_01890 [bacterium SM23_31]
MHLDCQFKGLQQFELDREIKDRIRNATFTAFDNLINLCIERHVDFLLIAGDAYNSADRNLGALLRFRDGMRRLAEAHIKVYVVHGNHDPHHSWSSNIDLPGNVHRFSDKTVKTEIFKKSGEPCAAIHGISYSKRDVSENLAKLFEPLTKNKFIISEARELGFDSANVNLPDLFQIGLLHCSVGTVKEHETYAPCSLKDDLIPSGIDYWALGHVHKRNVLHKQNPCVVYPGNIQGLHINETGARGCCMVSVNEQGKVNPEFIPVDDVRWYQEEIYTDGLDKFEDLEKAVETLFEGCGSESGSCLSIVRLILKGRGVLHESLKDPEDAKELLERFQINGLQSDPPVLMSSFDIQTRKQIDIESRRKTADLLGDFLNIVEEIRNNPEMMTLLRGQLAEFYNHPRAKKILAGIDDETLLHLLDKAESHCLDLLIGEKD